MGTLRAALALAIALSIAAGAATSQPVQAAIHSDPVGPTFNIFARGSFCAGGGTACSVGVGPGEVRSAQAEAYGAPGQTSGTPVHVFAGCGRIYTAANGHRIEAYL